MEKNKRYLIGLLILLPVLFLGILSIEPRPLALFSIWQSARLAAAQEKYSEAASFYRKIIEYQPERADLWDTIGGFEFKAGNEAAAVEAYEQAEVADEISNEGLFNLGTAYQNLGEIQAAEDAWLRLAEKPGLKSEEYSALVISLRKSGDLSGALKAAGAWFESDPRNIQAAYAYGLLLANAEPARALEILLPVSAEDSPEGANAHVLIEGLETAVNHELRDYGLVIVGQRLLQIAEYDVAEQSFSEAVRLNPGYAEAWAMLSEVKQSTGGDGFPALKKATELNPTSDIVRAELALYYRRQGKPEQALAVLRELAKAHPEQGSWYVEIGAALAEQGDLIEAMNAYQKAVEIEPKNKSVWQALAAFAAGNGFDSSVYSIPAIQNALEIDSDDPESLDLMGWILLIDGDLENAEQFLQQALQKDASYPRAMLHLAQVYIEKNRLSLAFKPLSQAASQTRDANTALQARRLLEQFFPSQQ